MGLLWGDRPREEDTHREAVGRGKNRDGGERRERKRKGGMKEKAGERKVWRKKLCFYSCTDIDSIMETKFHILT